ncbi:MAG: methyltransferase domain-containing protein [Magnetococcales bacterium]|nr:methyltransferase domain-containing protein [Magnetococcales bacterium]
MNTSFNQQQDWHTAISDTDFRRLSEFVYAQCGILMPLAKKRLLTNLMQERLHVVGIQSIKDYMDWVMGSEHSCEELDQFIDIVASREGRFFHEADHFEFLAQTALPEVIKHSGAGISRDFMIWNAGCGAGEEAYTLAIVLLEFSQHYPGIQFKTKVLATDLSSRLLGIASEATYGMDKISSVPLELKRRYFLKSKDPGKRLVRLTPEIRNMVSFRRLNMLDAEFGLREQMDVIFCRDLISHFDPATQNTLIHKVCRYLAPGGYLFLGHSENLTNLRVPLLQSMPAIYQMPQQGL